MKKLFLLFLALWATIASAQDSGEADKAVIKSVLDLWHKAASEARFKPYFALMTDDAVFIGTDPTENWQLDAFKIFAKPYFDKGKAWNFTAVERHIYLSDNKDIAWFDELLDTQMKLCRGSGVLKKVNGQWRIAHYVLSMTVPNDNNKEVVALKTAFDDELLKKLKGVKP
jgi:ketosteroid isomerase-like protein